MYKIELCIKNYAKVSIFTDFESLKEKLTIASSSLKRTIPISDTIITQVDDIEYKDSIVILNSQILNMYYDVINNSAVLNMTENQVRLPDIIYILLSMFSKLLEKDNKYLIHSSVVKKQDDTSIMIVGDANAGKTSLAYKLMQDYGCKLISNDHAIVGLNGNKAMVYGGTKEIQMRVGTLKMYFPDLFEKINVACSDIWEKKIIVNDYINQNMIANSDEEINDLTEIYNISTYYKGDTFLRRKEKIDELLFLYESISRQIKGTYNLITTFNYPMPSIENPEMLQRLSTNCKNVLDNVNIYEGKGAIDDLTKRLVMKK